MEGYIKLYRQIIDWQWFSDSNTFRLFMLLLLKANHKDGYWKGYKVKRGQHITSLEHLSIMLGISVQQIRTSINKLKSTGEITSKSTNRFSLLQLNNYDNYQSDNIQNNTPSNNQITIKQQSNNNQITTNKNDKNKKNDKNDKNIEKNIIKKENSFSNINKKEIIKKYNITEIELDNEIKSFINYWTETDKKGKQKREFQKTFEPNKRLATWLGNNNKWNKRNLSNKPQGIGIIE